MFQWGAPKKTCFTLSFGTTLKRAGFEFTWVIPWTFAQIRGLGRVDGIAFQLLYL
jgi:hypothetical protein